MARNNVSWFYESAAERKNSTYEQPASSFGAYQKEGTQTFDEHFNDLYEQYKESLGIDIKRDIRPMLADRSFMEQYKQDLMTPVFEGFREASPNDPHIESIIENVERFWDTKVNSYTESASMTGFLPIATLEFPVLVKQFFSSVLKDIIEVETVKSPNITKHIRTTYLVDNQTGEELEYPKCMFDGTWEKMWNASKGHKIRNDVVPFENGRLSKYDIISGLTDGVPGIDQLSFQFKIIAVKVGEEVIQLPGNGITVEFSTNGTLVNGDLKFTSSATGTEVEDVLAGQVNFRDGTISIASTSGQVEGVVFDGYLSNEKNMRSVSVRERRQILRFTIEDGARWNMPFSIEEIEDAAALLDINYYNRMVDEIVRTQEMQECMTVIKFLNEEFKKFNGVQTDTYKLESLAMTHTVDLNPPQYFAGDPFKYISTAVQFRLKSIVHQLTELTKLDGLSFVIVGNPMATQLLSEFVGWKSQQGTNIGGIDVNNSYGFATDMGANIRVVASNLYDAYTVDAVEATGKRELVLHIYGYPTSADHISFRHLKFTSHLLTSQSQTAYQSTTAPGGAYNIVTATSRFHTMSVQGIQADLIMLNSDRVYGEAPARPPIKGAPWDGADLTPIPAYTAPSIGG
jgi:hypothetical protein